QHPAADRPAARTPDLKATAAHLAHAASAELQHASEAAQHTFGKAAQELGKGWGTLNSFLDDMLAPAASSTASHRAAPSSDAQRVLKHFHQHFPTLPERDDVVDHFECTLIQKYRCQLNDATPEKVFPLSGTMFVTTSHIAMYIVDRHTVFSSESFGVTIPLADVAKIQKGAKSMLRLLTVDKHSYIFAQFESNTHFNAAISLLEHMTAPPQALSEPPRAQTPPSPADQPSHAPTAQTGTVRLH
ncbi:unnamed protein product, partial [Agarophyton chilense]